MRKSRLALGLVVVLALGLVSTACSKSDSSNDSKDSTTTTAAGPKAPTDAEIKALTAKLAGGGASFPDAYYQAVNADFNKVQGTELVTYAKSGSSDGRKQLAAKTLDFAGSDSLPKPEETFPGPVLYFPTVAAPITVAYNLQGVSGLKLSADTVAKIFSAQITSWDDPAIAAENKGAKLPATPIVVVHRSDGSGTTSNFTKYLVSAAPDTWKLGNGDTVNWPATTQGAEKNSGVAALIAQTAGGVGYVDLADAAKAKLSVAEIKNSSGNYVGPTAKGVQAALEAAEVKPDLTYNPLNTSGADAYPITAPTWIMTYGTYSDAAKVASLQTYLKYVLTTGQKQAAGLGYASLPSSLAQKAYDQVAQIKQG